MNGWFVSSSEMLFCAMWWMFGRKSSRRAVDQRLVHRQVDLRVRHRLDEALGLELLLDARRDGARWPRSTSECATSGSSASNTTAAGGREVQRRLDDRLARARAIPAPARTTSLRAVLKRTASGLSARRTLGRARPRRRSTPRKSGLAARCRSTRASDSGQHRRGRRARRAASASEYTAAHEPDCHGREPEHERRRAGEEDQQEDEEHERERSAAATGARDGAREGRRATRGRPSGRSSSAAVSRTVEAGRGPPRRRGADLALVDAQHEVGGGVRGSATGGARAAARPQVLAHPGGERGQRRRPARWPLGGAPSPAAPGRRRRPR